MIVAVDDKQTFQLSVCDKKISVNLVKIKITKNCNKVAQSNQGDKEELWSKYVYPPKWY